MTPRRVLSLVCMLLPLLSCGDGGTAPATTGTFDFDVQFRTTGNPTPRSCDIALVDNVDIKFYDPALGGLLRTNLRRPCVPNERYRVSIDTGTYEILVQGINGQLTVCYETRELHTLQGARTEVFTVTADQHPTGAQGGCTYPPIVRGAARAAPSPRRLVEPLHPGAGHSGNRQRITGGRGRL